MRRLLSNSDAKLIEKFYIKVYKKKRKILIRFIMNDLEKDIKNLHEILCSLIEDKELTDIEVVLCSHVLDKMIVKRMRESKIKMVNVREETLRSSNF